MASPGCSSPFSSCVAARLSFICSGSRWRRLEVAYTSTLSDDADTVPSSIDFSAL